MMRKIAAYATGMVFFAVAGAAETTGDAVAGKAKSELCQGCHGKNGMSEDAAFPRLAGQSARYIKKQMTDFQKELRKDDTMSPMAATVTEEQDLKDIAAYFASQKPMWDTTPQGAKTVAKPVDADGQNLFLLGNPAIGLFGCINCHGEKGRSGNNLLAPVIAGQHESYLIKQLNDFRSGARANDPAGMMSNIAQKMTDEDISAVAEYLSGL